MARLLPLLLVGLLPACAQIDAVLRPAPEAEPPRRAAPARAQPTAVAPPPPRDARTVEDFDTTTAEQRSDAAQPAEGGRLLGTTVASLGDPGRPGFWIETPLASAAGQGKVVHPATGKSAEVELLPASGGGSRVSLAALRLLGLPLTDLPTLEVYAF